MKKECFVLLLFSLFSFVSAKDIRGRFPFFSGFSQIAVTPSGELIIGVNEGKIYSTGRLDELWTNRLLKNGTDAKGYKERFEKIFILSENDIAVYGNVFDLDQFVYISENRGKTWERISLNSSPDITAGCTNGAGKIWLTPYGDNILYTDDLFKTTIQLPAPEAFRGERIKHIAFNRKGNLGALCIYSDTVALTNDNCQTWQYLPAPLVAVKKQAYGIDRIGISNDHLFVIQNCKFFYTDIHRLDWNYIATVADFALTDNGFLYTKNKDGSISLYDRSMNRIWHSDWSFDCEYYALVTVGNRLLANSDFDSYLISQDEFRKYPILTDEYPLTEPNLVFKHNQIRYGFSGKDILACDEGTTGWYRYDFLPKPADHSAVYRGQLLFFDYDLHDHYRYNPDKKTAEPFEFPALFFDADRIQIDTFKIETGTQGCFYYGCSQDMYKNDGNLFSLVPQKASSTEWQSIQPLGLSRHKDTRSIQRLLGLINRTSHPDLSLADLEIGADDIRRFKQDLFERSKSMQKAANKLTAVEMADSFNQRDLMSVTDAETAMAYVGYADSVLHLSDSVINLIFSTPYGNFSTTTHWTKVSFVLSDGNTISLYNEDDRPKYLYSPWIVDYNGLKKRVTSLEAGRLVDELGEGKLFDPKSKDKQYAILLIVKYLYERQLDISGSADLKTDPNRPVFLLASGAIFILLLALCSGFIRKRLPKRHL